MKYPIKNTVQRFLIVSLLFWLAGFCGFFIPVPAICDNSVADKIVSLNVTNRPLGEVLEDLSIAADCQFSIDESWEDYPITTSFNSEPLHRGLKRIFRDINNAVIYGADRTIKIVIYNEATFSGEASGHSVSTKSSQETIQQLQPFSGVTAPQPELGDPEDGSDAENVDQPPEETGEPASESDVADAENTEAQEEKSGEATAEEKTDVLETEQVKRAGKEEPGIPE